MYLILDACTILNLLQIDMEEDNDDIVLNNDYFKKLEKLNLFQIIIVKKVYQEIQSKYSKNLTTQVAKKFLHDYIKTTLYKYIPFHQYSSDYNSSLNFVKKQLKYVKDNGEVHSTAYSLYESRYNNTSILKNIFITDDDQAIKDFSDFFQINLLGQIIVTIDLLSILFINNILSKKDVVNFAYDLKRHYIKDYNILVSHIDNTISVSKPKDIALLSKIRELVNSLNFDLISSSIINTPKYRGLIRQDKKLDGFLKKVLSQDLKKITIIDKKILNLKKSLWTIDAA